MTPHVREFPRTVAICESCERVFAAREKPDGTLAPIGTAGTCPCGCEEFGLFRYVAD